MYRDIYFRTKEFANYIVDNNSTIRQCAKIFNVSKSTVHSYLKYKLPIIDNVLYCNVKKVLETNFEEKHIRGGFATRQKYLQEKLVKNYEEISTY